MDKIWIFIEAMSWRDWIAVIAFIVLPFTALNTFLGLKSRYKDWRGTKSKKNFEKRLGQLKQELAQIEIFKKNLPAFFLHVLAKAMPALGLFFAALGLFMGAYTINRIPVPAIKFIEWLYLGVGILCVFMTIAIWIKLFRLIEIVNRSVKFGLELLEFIYVGRQKGYIIGEEEFILSLMKNSKIFTDDERAQLFSRSFDLDRSSINEYATKPVHRDNGA